MKLRLFLSLLLLNGLISNCINAETKSDSITKHALIFAIGDYPESGGWPKISSGRDISFIKKVLEQQNFKDIKVVEDKDASVKGITGALNDLIAKVSPGDVVAIHFSSHGEQIEDETGKKINGLEESIVTYDAKLSRESGSLTQEQYDQFKSGYLREDVFGSYINKLRSKLGKSGDVAIFMDLCHASVGTRGSGKARGGKPALVSPNFQKNHKTTTTGNDFDVDVPVKVDGNDMASYIVIGAARAEELDYETEDDTKVGVGALSYAISKAFSNLGKNTNVTYRTLFAQIQTIMNEKQVPQHPVLSGNGQDRQIFGGHYVPQKSFIELSAINGKQIVLNAGKFLGIDEGAKIAIYPAGTNDTVNLKPLAFAKIITSTLYTSTATLEKILPFKQPSSAWGFIVEPVYKYPVLKIQVVSDQNKSRGATLKNFSSVESLKIENAIKTLPKVTIDNIKPDLKIIKGDQFDSIMIAATGLLFDTVENAGAGSEILKVKIKNYIQYEFLKNLKIQEPNVAMDVKLAKLVNNIPDTININNRTSNYIFMEGDTIMLWVKNTGQKSLYFNVLDLQPNGIINPVVPIHSKDATVEPEELLINAGVSHLFNNYRIELNPPYGTEIFKIFISEMKINMESIANTRGAGTRGLFSALEGLVKDSYQSRGVTTKIPVGQSSGTTYNLLFEIQAKK